MLKENYFLIKNSLPADVELVAVSKTHPVETIRKIYDLGQRVFGENRVQELLEKHDKLPADIEWHLIGHLQTNKVKQIVKRVHMIQSVDSERLLLEINRQAQRQGIIVTILLQVKIAAEESKYGLEESEAEGLFRRYTDGEFSNIKIKGLMGMATFTEDNNIVKKEFQRLKLFFDKLSSLRNLDTLSMGMSNDYEAAIACGATSVRIGSAIFGQRGSSLP